MTDKDLRRLSRGELIEIIYQYRMKTDELTAENERLTSQLNERIIKISQSGSIAEAALALSKVFEAAQSAADQYLESVKALTGVIKPETSDESKTNDQTEEANEQAPPENGEPEAKASKIKIK